MSDKEKYHFVVVKYPQADTGQEALGAVKVLAKDKVVKLKDAVAITKTEKGKIKLHQTKDDPAGKGLLKGIDVDIPRDQLVIITGLSGSGKSSLAFDTIFAEGQRKYMESLSAYARQFLDQLKKPDIEEIEVATYKEVKRFHVATRVGDQGFSVKVSDGGTRRIHKEVAKAGEGAFYEFDYGDYDNAVIVAPVAVVPLKEWADEQVVS